MAALLTTTASSGGGAVAAVDEDSVDLFRKPLMFYQQKRLTAEESLSHPNIRWFHNAADEPALNYQVG